MQINPYLNFGGNCEEAFKFYETVLGGSIVMLVRSSETPMADMFPPDWHDKIMHIRMVVGDAVIMGSDAPPPYFEKPAGFSVSIIVDTPEKAETTFAALSVGGTVKMAMEETFWAQRFGMLIDKFGIHWMVNCEKSM